MPSGVPVATVHLMVQKMLILAMQILGTHKEIQKIIAFKSNLKEKVMESSNQIKK